jgi:hypothetical protein
MTQNLISLDFGVDDIAAIDKALDILEAKFDRFVTLTPDQIRRLNKMGDKSEAFCRQATVVLEENPQLIPPGFSVAELRQDVTDLDLMRPRFLRLRELLEKADSTEMALGSDIINAALEGYGYIKMGGKSAGLDGLREGMNARFGNRRGKPGNPAA